MACTGDDDEVGSERIRGALWNSIEGRSEGQPGQGSRFERRSPKARPEAAAGPNFEVPRRPGRARPRRARLSRLRTARRRQCRANLARRPQLDSRKNGDSSAGCALQLAHLLAPRTRSPTGRPKRHLDPLLEPGHFRTTVSTRRRHFRPRCKVGPFWALPGGRFGPPRHATGTAGKGHVGQRSLVLPPFRHAR